MSVIADVTVPTESFALHRALTTEPDVRVEAERLATHSVEWVLPFLWMTDGDFETFHRAILDDPTVADASVAEKFDDSVLYKVEWDDAVTELVTAIIDQHANVLEAKAHGESWRLRMRFSEDEQVSSFQRHFANRGYSFEVNQIYHPSAPRQREFALTSAQRDTLVTAYRNGYFNVPRDVSITELARSLGISSNATSQRIRRGTNNLIRHTLLVGETGTADRT